MANIPYVDQILEKSKMTGKSEDSLMGHVKNLLVDRGIMLEKPSSKSYVLSEAGKAFFEELMENKHRFMDKFTFSNYIIPNPRKSAAPIAIPNRPTTVVNAKILAANMSFPPIAFAIT